MQREYEYSKKHRNNWPFINDFINDLNAYCFHDNYSYNMNETIHKLHLVDIKLVQILLFHTKMIFSAKFYFRTAFKLPNKKLPSTLKNDSTECDQRNQWLCLHLLEKHFLAFISTKSTLTYGHCSNDPSVCICANSFNHLDKYYL